METESLPLIIVACVGLLLLAGVGALAGGRRVGRYGAAVVAAGLLAVAIGIGLGFSALLEPGQKPVEWLRGWVGSPHDPGTIAVGILQDRLGLAMASVLSVLAALCLAAPPELASGGRGEPRPERFAPGLALSLAGSVLAWIALTPWFGFVGLLLTALGGFVGLGARAESEADARLATQFLWQRIWGLAFAILGACALTSDGTVLSWAGGAPAWAAGADVAVATAGVALLMGGLAVQLQPFPLQGWLVTPGQAPILHRVALAQVFPAWAALALLLRISPRLATSSVLPVFGWILLASSLLALLCAFFQTTENWRQGFGLWFSAAFTLTGALLVFAGPAPAVGFLVGATLGGMAMAFGASALDLSGNASQAQKSRAGWSKAAITLGTLAATGMAGFATSAAFLRWLPQAWRDSPLTAAVDAMIFLFALLGARLGRRMARQRGHTRAGWAFVLAPFLLLLAAMAWAWTGSATGGAVPGNPDQFAPSLLDWLLGPLAAVAPADETTFWTATGIFWGVFLVGAITGYATAGSPDARGAETKESFTGFLAHAYRIDELANAVNRGVARAGAGIYWLLDRKIWREWIPNGASATIRKLGSVARISDYQLTLRLRNSLRHSVEVPAKGLQVIQSGDVQWYLIFAIGSGIALLLHFLRSLP